MASSHFLSENAKCLFMCHFTRQAQKIQIQDGDHFWRSHRPPAAPCLIYFFVQFELKFRAAGEGEFDNAEQRY